MDVELKLDVAVLGVGCALLACLLDQCRVAGVLREGDRAVG